MSALPCLWFKCVILTPLSLTHSPDHCCDTGTRFESRCRRKKLCKSHACSPVLVVLHLHSHACSPMLVVLCLHSCTCTPTRALLYLHSHTCTPMLALLHLYPYTFTPISGVIVAVTVVSVDELSSSVSET